ncbi:MAG: hypothetical protein EAZ16_06885 [Sphingobacteriales bacterium]|jgi:hypothetical protein|nr:MAG: hypothetical protein EAZ16_06885 [Sphingobacteriales bacterium]
MKSNKSIVWAFVALVVVAALYRIIPNRPLGFAPQFAIALFGGAMIKDKKWAFALPVLSMFLSDLMYQGLYSAGLTDIKGFYTGIYENYILIAAVTVFGFFMKQPNLARVTGYAIIAPTSFFIISNLLVWLGGGIDITTQLPLAKTWAGLAQCYAQAWPFYVGSVISTLVFSGVLFGGYYLITRNQSKTAVA